MERPLPKGGMKDAAFGEPAIQAERVSDVRCGDAAEKSVIDHDEKWEISVESLCRNGKTAERDGPETRCSKRHYLDDRL